MYYDFVDKFGDKCFEKVCVEVVIYSGINCVRSQCGVFGNGVVDVCGEERYYQCQFGDIDIKQFFKIWIGGGIGYGVFVIQYDGDCQ